MRTSYFAAAAMAVCLLNAGTVAAQGVATYSKEAIDDLANLLNKAEKDGFKMAARTTTMFGGWLPKGQKQGTEPWVPMLTVRNLDPMKTYRVVAAGDNDSRDLDLRIVDPTGKIVTQDVTVLRNAEVTFTPTRQQDYVIEVRLYDSRDNCFCIGGILNK